MTDAISAISPLAQQGRADQLAQQMAEGFRGTPTQINPLAVAVGLLGIAGVLLVWWIATRLSPIVRRSKKPHPWRLFFGLCRVHRLGWADRWFLWQLGRRQKLADPARLFLEPERLEPPSDLPQRQLRRLTRISDRVFLGLAEPGVE